MSTAAITCEAVLIFQSVRMMTLESLSRAAVHGVRWMLRRPLSFLTSALCLGTGIAACAASWTLLDSAIFRPFGLAEADRLVVVWEADFARGRDLVEVSHLNFLDWQRRSRTLESLAAFGSSHWPSLARVGSDTLPLATRAVSQAFFSTLAIRPAVGRDFAASDLQPDAVAPVILSHRLWQSRFGASNAIVGQTLLIDGSEHQIIGVMPPGFGYPEDPDAWISVERALMEAFEAVPIDQQRKVGVLEVLGRRRADVTDEDVRAELNAIISDLRRRYDPGRGEVTAVVNRYTDVLLGRLGSRLWITLAMAVVVLLFACGNVAAVRIAQFRERATELSARIVLGSTRSRLAMELAVEAAALVLAAGVVALLLWSAVVALLSGASVIAASGVTLNERRSTTAVVLSALTLVSWALVGVVPAWRATLRYSLELQLSSRRVVHRTTAVGAPLLFGQAVAALVVVSIAGAALQTFDRLSGIDVGFSTTGVTLVDVALPESQFESEADRHSLTGRFQEALKQLPGVTHVAAVSLRPFRFGAIADGVPVRRAGDSLVSSNDALVGSQVVVTPDYFASIGQSIVEGRSFSDFDRRDTDRIVIVSQAVARTLWGTESAVGKRLQIFTVDDDWQTLLVVGVAADARYRALERPSSELYIPYAQTDRQVGTYIIRHTTAGLSEEVLRHAMRRVEPDVAVEHIQTTRELVSSVLSPARLLATVISLLAGAGLLLLTVGIFGAAATALRAAWTEIAVRQAIGALPVQAAWAPLTILSRALVVGVAVGLLVAPAALSALEVVGIQSSGMAVPLMVSAFAVVLAAAGAVGPCLWRAARTSPADLLREN